MDKIMNVIKFAFLGAGFMELLLYASDIGGPQVILFETWDLQEVRLGLALGAFLLYFVTELLEPPVHD